MRGRPRLESWGAETLAEAEATFGGSAHIREVVDQVVGPLPGPVLEVPPGVDVDVFTPAPGDVALAGLIAESRADPPNPGNANERLPDEGNADRLAAFFAEGGPVVVYFGKLIVNKGVHLLLDAIRGLDVRALVVGFGDYRGALELQAHTLPAGQTLFTGPLEHRHLVHLLPLCDVAVVPSIFPEAFGLVAAEAAAAGCPPLVARHSGLAEVAAGLEAEYPVRLRNLAAFESGDVGDLRMKLEALLALPAADREAVREAARRAVVRNWSWNSVAERLLAPVA
jgi:glycosyltransferase involved in cell wall biosynthesis